MAGNSAASSATRTIRDRDMPSDIDRSASVLSKVSHATGLDHLMELSTERRDAAHADLDQRPTVDVVHAVVRGHQEVLAAVDVAAHAIAALADATAGRMDVGGRVIYVGAGSAGRIALLDASEWGPTFSEDAVIALLAGADLPPFEEAAAEDDAEAGAAAVEALVPTPNDVVIGVTASGHTPYVLGALEARTRGGRAHGRDHLARSAPRRARSS